VPAGKLFVIGDASLSDDSRYWGYLDASKVVGTAHRLF
jgi:conjugal transfer pilin signal peptidase TrbI